MDYSPLGSSVQGILQARILQWVAIPFSRGSSCSRDWTQVFCIAGRLLTVWATKETHTKKKRQDVNPDLVWFWVRDHTYCLDAQSYLRLLCSYKEVLLRSMWTNLATEGQPCLWAKYSFTPADWSGPNHSHLPSWQCFPSIFWLATISISSSRASTFLSIYKVSLL